MEITTFTSIGGGLVALWSSALNLSAIGWEANVKAGEYRGEIIKKESGVNLFREMLTDK